MRRMKRKMKMSNDVRMRYAFDRSWEYGWAGESAAAGKIRVHASGGFMDNLAGLMGCSGMPRGFGLWLSGCSSIHMLFMRFAIDVVWLGKADGDGRAPVVGVDHAVKPWRLAFGPAGAKSCIEVAAETAPEGIAWVHML